MTTYEIRRQPGPQAQRNREQWERMGYSPSMPRTRLMGKVAATGVVDALGEFLYQHYLKPENWNRQYAGSRVEFLRRGRWVEWDSHTDDLTEAKDSKREWRLTVTLRNGRSSHDVHYSAWRSWQ